MVWRAPLQNLNPNTSFNWLKRKAGENNIFCSAYNEMPCAATDNVLQKRLLMAVVMKGKRIKNSDSIFFFFLSIQAACCLYRQILE